METVWAMTVPSAAPLTPHPSQTMNIASRMMLSTAPMIMPVMPTRELPSARMRLRSVLPKTLKTVPLITMTA